MKFVLAIAVAACFAAPAKAEQKYSLTDAMDAMSVPLAYTFACAERYGNLDARILEHLVDAAEQRGYQKANRLHRDYLAAEVESQIQLWGRAGLVKICRMTKIEMDSMAAQLDKARR